MLILAPEAKEELLKNIDKTLMQAAVGKDFLGALKCCL